MRLLLESPYVSNNIHSWINIIFGPDQKGSAAVNKINLFMSETYEAEAIKKYCKLKSHDAIDNLERQ